MSLTSVLAIIGTATGTLSLAIQAIAAARDRPKLRLNVGFTTTLGARPEAWIDVHNEGSRPTTVREIGFYAGPWQFETSEALRATGFFKTPLADEPQFLEAGRTVRARGVPDAVDAGFPADFPLRGYAIDQRGRYVWGSAAGITRWLVGPDPPPFVDEPDTFRRLFDDQRGELKPAQVEPRWKLWKRKELRCPGSWQPEDEVRHFAIQYKRRSHGDAE